jgi:hypothetical protein
MKDNDTPVIALLKTPSIDLPHSGRLIASTFVEDTLAQLDRLVKVVSDQ